LPRALEHLKLLDLSQSMGAYCSKLLANMGADVTLIEPLQGHRQRSEGPFLHNQRDPSKSLKFHYLHADKKSLCMDIEKTEGKLLLKKMFDRSDIVIESFTPGYLQSLGLSYEQLQEEYPHLIWCSITPFGQFGPYREYKADDLTLMSMGGMAYLAGYPDDSPLASFGEISYYSASLCAAVAIMIALQNRHKTNAGDFIDVSIQECVALGTETAPQFYDLQGSVRKRLGYAQREPGMGIYPCKDGYILFYAGEIGGGTGWVRLVEWLNEEEIPDAEQLLLPQWRDKEWKKKEEAKEIFYPLMEQFTKRYTKDELFMEGQRRKVALGPINHAKDLADSVHLKDRQFFGPVSQIEQEEVLGPGAPYRLSITPWRIEKPAPAQGEDNVRILQQLGFDDQDVSRLKEMGVIT
jgi:benzylsuccinate CoA-transferase BbsE subunit